MLSRKEDNNNSDCDGRLRLDSALLHALLTLLLPLFLQELPLFLCTKSSQLSITLLLLELISGQLALFSLLFLVQTADLGDLLFTCLPDATQGLRAKVCSRGEVIG